MGWVGYKTAWVNTKRSIVRLMFSWELHVSAISFCRVELGNCRVVLPLPFCTSRRSEVSRVGFRIEILRVHVAETAGIFSDIPVWSTHVTRIPTGYAVLTLRLNDSTTEEIINTSLGDERTLSAGKTETSGGCHISTFCGHAAPGQMSGINRTIGSQRNNTGRKALQAMASDPKRAI
ncbi:uncharacterized protein EI90DRAFT_3019411 [Cantharellus anzutake]|uniref:uncharacterized protein n=1 Tax=Cantharellus anzutake TaxID=1750568 RepID=UPI001902C6DD|nr:uncharacterized protein EI90DRAFT_3019411 [Cantharellus anzutake]KAF8324784.1 hypothetical protein EI90DRAFT_3019411 [Cantharellus anzutake]